jgi:hypothetical protein
VLWKSYGNGCVARGRANRPREAPDVWCLENRPKSPSNSQISGPQIVKFGQRMPHDVLKWQFFLLTQKCLITLLKLGNKRQQAVIVALWIIL